MHTCRRFSRCQPRRKIFAARRGGGTLSNNSSARCWEQLLLPPILSPSPLRLQQPNSSEEELLQQQLEQDIRRANHGELLNVNSPKQVSLAIFGTIQSTAHKVLERASKGEGVTYERQQTLASLVLQHRALTKKRAKQRQQSTAFSTLVAIEKNDDTDNATTSIQEEHAVNEMVDDDSSIVGQAMPRDSVVPVTYGQTVEDLFDKKSKMNFFWKEPLLLVTKPSARNMVLQLNPSLCPMGYDPTAAPTASLKTTTEPTAGKKGSLLAYVRENKQRYPDCIILTRVGDFYETYGTDAVLLVEVRDILRGIMCDCGYIYV